MLDARFSNLVAALAICFLLVLATGCQTVAPLPAVDFNQPGWTVRQGQAVWKRGRNMPEIAGDIIVATGPDGRSFVQFSKNPFPLMIAQSTANSWQVETPTDNKRYSGRGNPPKRLIFLYVPRVLEGKPLPPHWTWQKLENNGWRLQNPANGESLEVYFMQ